MLTYEDSRSEDQEETWNVRSDFWDNFHVDIEPESDDELSDLGKSEDESDFALVHTTIKTKVLYYDTIDETMLKA